MDIPGLVRNPVDPRSRIFVAIGMTGLLRAEWVLARYGQAMPCNWSMLEYQGWLDTFAPLGYLVADWRNLAVKTFLEHGYEWLVFIDHDVVLPHDFYVRLNERIIKERIPIWSGLYFTRSTPSEPILYRDWGTGYFADWRMGEQVWVKGIPMGCTVIHSSLLKAVWEESEEYKIETPKTGSQTVRRVFETPLKVHRDLQGVRVDGGTEDLNFCQRLIENRIFEKAGWPEYQEKEYPILCDTAICCRHIDQDGTMYPAKGEDVYFFPGNPR